MEKWKSPKWSSKNFIIERKQEEKKLLWHVSKILAQTTKSLSLEKWEVSQENVCCLGADVGASRKRRSPGIFSHIGLVATLTCLFSLLTSLTSSKFLLPHNQPSHGFMASQSPFKSRPFCFTFLILISTFLLHFKFLGEDFPGGPVVKNPPDNAGFMGLISGLKYPHVPGQVSLCTMTTEARALETGLCNKRSPHNKKPKHRK